MILTVILPCYNAADTLAVQLEALSRQTLRDGWDLLFVDNGSTDRSLAILEEFRPRLPPVTVLQAYDPSRGRKGVAFSYALAFQAASGDALVLCEADDEVADDYVEQMAGALGRHELVAGALDYARLNPPDIVGREPRYQTREHGLFTRSGPLFLPFAMGCAFGLRRSVWERIGLPADEIGPAWDTEYCWRAQQAGIELSFVPEAVVHYRLRVTWRSRYRQAESWSRGHVRLHLRYGCFDPAAFASTAPRRLRRTFMKLAGVPLGHRSFRNWVWDLGWAMGWRSEAAAAMRALREERGRHG